MSILSIVANSALVAKPNANAVTLKWQRPDPRQVKLNVDASFHIDSLSGGTSAVIRDFEGRLIAASCSLIPHASFSGNVGSLCDERRSSVGGKTGL
jgi:hypothetical protein